MFYALVKLLYYKPGHNKST